jgi:hypothetical protein
MLQPGTVCRNKYLVVSRRRMLRKLGPEEFATAVVVEFEKHSNSQFQYYANVQGINREGAGGSPGCGGEDRGTIIKRGGKWERRISALHGTTDARSTSRDAR